MDRCYFIDKETFEVYEEHPKVFSCDPKLGHIVSQLNKLGYKTLASCEGHYEIREYDISYPKEKMKTGIYVLFQGKCKFPNIPKDFVIEEWDEKTCLTYAINYYDAFGHYKNRIEFEQEKSKYIKRLADWVKCLPKRER